MVPLLSPRADRRFEPRRLVVLIAVSLSARGCRLVAVGVVVDVVELSAINRELRAGPP